MKKTYNVEEVLGQTVIWYEENGVRVSFTANENNPDYQAYLRHLAGEDEGGTL